MQQGQPLLERGDLSFRGLGALGGVEQRLVEPGAVGPDRRDLGLEPGADFGVAGQPLLDRLQLALPRQLLVLLDLRFTGQLVGVGGAVLRACGRRAKRKPRQRHKRPRQGTPRSRAVAAAGRANQIRLHAHAR
ncbi:MAG: hypothetical protein ACK4VM_04015 [Bosea sp. (in: a-proteobacteria)]